MKLYKEPKKGYLPGKWIVTAKIDGVQAIYKDGVVTSRSGKPLHNLPPAMDGVYEVFLGNWEKSVSAVRTHDIGHFIESSKLFRLEPEIDPRLYIDETENLYHATIMGIMETAVGHGYEGLVLRGPNGERLKVKTTDNYDVEVTGVISGKGKHEGRMGALMTPMGKVGTGFTDSERSEVWTPGETIEVECMQLTPDGKFRHPRFVRRRVDK